MRVRRARDETGYTAVLVAILFPLVFLGLAAIAVDVSRWYVEGERVQKAADAAALAGVTYMPDDIALARSAAVQVSTRNGFPNSGGSTVSVVQGTKPSQINVTVTSTIGNTFGKALGFLTHTVSRHAVTDYTGPAPMGSPCNTFGNEPNSNSGAALPAGSVLPTTGGFANCSRNPQFWGTIEGPQTHKGWGDRYSTKRCERVSAAGSGAAPNGTDGCSGDNNAEYREQGYFWVVRVLPAAVNKTITLQLYDPAYVQTGRFCETMPTVAVGANPYYPATDSMARFAAGSSTAPPAGTPNYCTGDFDPDGLYGETPATGESTRVDTSFVLREQTDTLNPLLAPVISGCVKQYRGHPAAPTDNNLRSSVSSTYDRDLARVFHQWVDFCQFTPARAGDYYLQVRSNVRADLTMGDGQREAGSVNTNSNPDLVLKDNPRAYAATGNSTTGRGDNSFGIRAHIASTPSLDTSVSVAGWEKMPIYANASGATSVFNLIRVVPAAAGKSLSFSFFDVGDAAGSGSVTVLKPTDPNLGPTLNAASSISGCRGVAGPVTGALTGCAVNISNATHNGKVQTIFVPIPADYTCNKDSAGGCWFRVQVAFPAGTSVNDITTWDANVTGDPVRLIE